MCTVSSQMSLQVSDLRAFTCYKLTRERRTMSQNSVFAYTYVWTAPYYQTYTKTMRPKLTDIHYNTVLRYWCETMVQGRFFMTIVSAFFIMISWKIIPLTYDQTYLCSLILKIGISKINYYNWKLSFFMINYTIITSFQTNSQRQHWFQIKVRPKI